jgi:hypothetical protein
LFKQTWHEKRKTLKKGPDGYTVSPCTVKFESVKHTVNDFYREYLLEGKAIVFLLTPTGLINLLLVKRILK